MERPVAPKGSIARAIRVLRAARGLSQIEVAAAIGRTRQTMRSYEREPDGVIPPPEVLAALAGLFGVPEAMLREGLVPEEIGRQVGTPRAVREVYGLSDADVANVPGLGLALLRMPPDVYSLAYDFLADLDEAGVSVEAQDRVHVFLTHLATGQLTPGYDVKTDGGQHEDAIDALAFLRRVFARRGIDVATRTIDAAAVQAAPVSTRAPETRETPDPDALSGVKYVRSLQQGKRKPKAG